jgi:hypothetical protein
MSGCLLRKVATLPKNSVLPTRSYPGLSPPTAPRRQLARRSPRARTRYRIASRDPVLEKAGFVIVWSRWIKRKAWAYFHPYCVRYAPATPNHGDNIDQYYIGVEMQVHEWRFESLLLGSIFGSWLFPCLPPCSVSLLDPVCVLSVQTMRSGTSCMRGSRRSFCPAMFSWQSVRRRHA